MLLKCSDLKNLLNVFFRIAVRKGSTLQNKENVPNNASKKGIKVNLLLLQLYTCIMTTLARLYHVMNVCL